MAGLSLAGGCTSTLSSFEHTLAARDSATAALGDWCAARRIADPPVIAAHPVVGDSRSEPDDIRALLAISLDTPLGYRHVRLTCGDTVLSEAHNWYVLSRLTPAMNETLATTDTPFGKVAATLRFSRERLSARRGAAEGCPAGTFLSHRARLRLADGTPLALVVECYTAANLTQR